jgi:hypothetical protein
MNKQEKGSNETQEMTAKNLLKGFLDLQRLRVETLEAKTASEAAAQVHIAEVGLQTVTAEVVDENSGLWAKDSNPCHPYRFACSAGLPIPAAKMESLMKSFSHISFSPNGQSAVIFLGQALAEFGKLVPAADGKEACYLLPLKHCVIIHRHE